MSICTAACAAAVVGEGDHAARELQTAQESGAALDSKCLLPAPKLKGRPRGRPTIRPRIDIDNEIEEASRLAELFKRMQHCSKIASRNALRGKQRLLRKANKLSEQDLLRLAVLKRCGLVQGDVPEGGDEDVASSGTPQFRSPIEKGNCSVEGKLHGMVFNIPGATELLKSLEKGCGGLEVAGASTPASGSSTPLQGSSDVLLRRGLKRLPPRPQHDAHELEQSSGISSHVERSNQQSDAIADDTEDVHVEGNE